MGGQVRPLRANLAHAELTHDGRQTAFDDQLDVGSLPRRSAGMSHGVRDRDAVEIQTCSTRG